MPDPYPERAAAYERALLSLPDELRGAVAHPLTMGRYLCFRRCLAALDPLAVPVLTLGAHEAPTAAPTGAELRAYEFAITADEEYLRRSVLLPAALPDIIAGGTIPFDVTDRAILAARYDEDAAALRACGVDILPKSHREEHPLEPEERSFPPGVAGLLHVAAKATGSDPSRLAWSMSLPLLLVHAHCEWVGNGADCAPAGYREARRRALRDALAAQPDATDPEFAAALADMTRDEDEGFGTASTSSEP